jgi:phosphate transport system permease protein
MHMGFHIYDVGFQSPNVEAARPMVYATALLLVLVILLLNITAIGVRNHLREKFRGLET